MRDICMIIFTFAIIFKELNVQELYIYIFLNTIFNWTFIRRFLKRNLNSQPCYIVQTECSDYNVGDL